ncbi:MULTISPECIES: bifunctional phosphopantothenoylcysteine decarboxylase/phosphopantothenate--cysteine ligase CoaBC [unclassified Cupriavidus]|jgi:phosphopantothenoylcysteine decarboxylase / phosphopantothenate---cysteine ligase|uniref:bifunctional phosphopantothenoylcysteine decarboxylase/phosphopantothenate--cysteine ligase CoaBC n=1 Tax=unclassified Cupriavidus TaxID=2640874 RepID=UPI001C000AC0|nr:MULTISPECIES: bifunctional phosphopantothenoylcysteine decarboxylase/phosphopantothenate--cysteine ligase CoaBC [unclassified Cupriavidus]MCA3188141.1 bifunctional phosphopantothenoylcysteine decarboxylase/phosphopantothenate--cysteine ligase CoaBC [Cupriavidus sp.]MCA3191110.1 bifunctional phosphopantothenoylcysteine decarboxylase/phosphopantothenate--cysteine ligase CoaBC [Cupriavidus sp.]MCA3195168.1 bifunctional phosphopantothenoylcysteine decarboxylase/phosphopantothenate--cysteine ligas
MDLRGKHIVLGLTGGIACYKSAELVRLLTKAGATVQVAMTEAATHFITPVTMQALSGRPVFLSQWDARVDNNMAHIDLSREADAILIAPASTDFLAKVANGLCDDLLTTLCIARECPLLVAPAMNRQMWAAAPTQRNAAQLRADGVTILGPGTGDQACGEIGDGRMLEPEELVEDLIAFFQPKPLQGKRVLITAGPTFEAIDPVRGITNLSSGKMGFSIARAAREAGADVLLVAGPTSLPTPRGVARTDIRSAQQMHDAVMAQLRDVDVFVAVAAVADWRPAEVAQQKLKKANDTDTPTLQFVQNPDILAAVAARADAPYCVGFAAESENLEQYGEQKRQRKGVPLLVGNIGHHTFGLDDNEIVLFDAKGMTRLPRADKLSLARELVAAIGQRLPRKSV